MLVKKLGNYVQAMESYAAIEEFVNSEGARENLPTVSTWSLYLVWQNGESNWKTPELFVKQSIATEFTPSLPIVQINAFWKFLFQ